MSSRSFADTAASWGLPLSAAQLDQFATYAAELQQWNQRVNLTAITRSADVYVRHFLDSLHCALPLPTLPDSLVDVGSGAGFPGVPLKILYPDMRLTLVESVGKKAAFLEHLVGRLRLEAVTVLSTRAEILGHDPHHRECYAVATARAVAELRVLVEYCLPLVRCDGYLLAPKGTEIDDEVARAARALTFLGGRVEAVAPVHLPGVEPRSLVVIRKITTTPPAYPRAVGMPARRPL